MRYRVIVGLLVATGCSAPAMVPAGSTTSTGGGSTTTLPGVVTFTPVDDSATSSGAASGISTTGVSSGGVDDTGASTTTGKGIDTSASSGSSSSGSSSGGSSSSGPGSTLFEHCNWGADCDPDQLCNNYDHWCTVGCASNSDCPEAPTGNATPKCSNLNNDCYLDCANGKTCPDGMQCAMTLGYVYCTF